MFLFIFRLFFGGFWYIKLESIYITKKKKNFKVIVIALAYFDSMISGSSISKKVSRDITDKHASLISSLFYQFLNKKEEKNMIGLDEYIKSSFQCFVQNKVNICLSYPYLGDVFQVNEKMRNLILYKLESNLDFKISRDDGDLTNLLRIELLRVFHNVRTVELITNIAGGNKKGSITISMISLLSVIKDTSLQRIFILSYGDDRENDKYESWQSYLWKLSSSKLMDKYSKLNYKIDLKYKIGFRNKYHGFVINKQSV